MMPPIPSRSETSTNIVSGYGGYGDSNYMMLGQDTYHGNNTSNSGYYNGPQRFNNNIRSQHQSQQQQQPQGHRNYAMLGCYSQNMNGWAGVPLISTAVSANRRPRKYNSSATNQPTSPSSSSSTSSLSPSSSTSSFYHINHHNGANNVLKQRVSNSNPSVDCDEKTLSRLAVHAHGAPLILTGRYRNRVQNNRQHPQQQSAHKQHHFHSNNDFHTGHSTLFNASSSSALNKITENKQNICNKPDIQMSFMKISEDDRTTNAMTTSAAAAAATDTCLPRIIKPRKRRKKDRKPTNATYVAINDNGSHNNNRNNNGEIQNSGNGNFMKFHNGRGGDINRNNVSADANYNNKFISNLNQNVIKANNNYLPAQLNRSLELKSESGTSTCYCRLCDPSRRIWAFPLRRSHSDNSADTEYLKTSKSKDFGVIGSNRSWSSNKMENKTKEDWRRRSSPFPSRNDSFSDSSDSGCADISNGTSLLDDMFHNNHNQASSVDRTNSTISCDSGCSSSNCFNLNFPPCGNDEFRGLDIDFPTAETLLTESINEISKKLMETCDLRSSSSDSSSVFSDSGIGSANLNSFFGDELIFNFENLNVGSGISNGNNIENGCYNGNIFKTPNNIFDSQDNHFPLQGNFLNFHDSNNNNNGPDNELLNCFDMVLKAAPPAGILSTIGII